MAQTFGINISQVGVPKYQETKLKPLDSADLSRFFNMSMQQKEFAQKNELMKADTLYKTHEILKNFNYMLKDAPDVEEDLNKIGEALKNAKTPQESLEVLSQTAAFMISPKAIRAVKQYKTYQETLDYVAKNRDKFSEDALSELTQIIEAETSFGLGPNGERIVGDTERLKQKMFQLLSASYGNTLEDQQKKQQLELTEAYKNSQIALNEEKLKELELKNQRKIDADEIFAKIMENPEYSDETKMIIASLRAEDPKLYAETMGALVAYKIYGDAATKAAIKQAVQAREGKNENRPEGNTNVGPGGIDPNSVPPEINDILNKHEVNYYAPNDESKPIGDVLVKNPLDKKFYLSDGAKAGMETEYFRRGFVVDKDGNVTSEFNARPYSSGNADPNEKDIYDDNESLTTGIFGHGSWSDLIPEVSPDDPNIIKENAKTLSSVLSVWDTYNFEKPTNLTPEQISKKQYYIKKDGDEAVTNVFVRFTPHGDNKDSSPLQLGYITTNNPQLVRKFINDNKGRGEAWIKEHVGFSKTSSIPTFYIKNVAWTPQAQTNINSDDIRKATDYLVKQKLGVTSTNIQQPSPNNNATDFIVNRQNGLERLKGLSYSDAGHASMINSDYVAPTTEQDPRRKALEQTRNQILYNIGHIPAENVKERNQKLLQVNALDNMLLNNTEVVDAFKNLPAEDMRVTPKELIQLHPFMLGVIKEALVDPAEYSYFLAGISDITAGNVNRSANSFHQKGMALDFTMKENSLKSNPRINAQQAGKGLLFSIIKTLGDLKTYDPDTQTRNITIYLEGADDAEKNKVGKSYDIEKIKEIASLYGYNMDPNKGPVNFEIKKGPNAEHAHLHLEVGGYKNLSNKNIPSSTSRDIITKPATSNQNTEGLNDLNLR